MVPSSLAHAVPGSAVLQLANVVRQFAGPEGAVPVLAGANLRVNAGEIVALVGPSGSGKSTLLACAAGIDHPDQGTVAVAGHGLNRDDEAACARVRREHIGFVFQDFRLFAELTAHENVRLPLELLGRGDAAATADQWLEEVGLTARRHHRPGQLSGGERQRVAIARALASGPALVLADEPTGSLDRITGDRIAELLIGLARARATAVLLVTHDRAVAERADRIVTMSEGRCVAEMSLDRSVTIAGTAGLE